MGGEALLLWSWVFLLFISSVNIQFFAYRCGIRAQVMIPSYYKQTRGHALTFQRKRSRGLGWYRVAEAVKMVPADPLCWVCGFGIWESSCSLHLFCRSTTLWTSPILSAVLGLEREDLHNLSPLLWKYSCYLGCSQIDNNGKKILSCLCASYHEQSTLPQEAGGFFPRLDLFSSGNHFTFHQLPNYFYSGVSGWSVILSLSMSYTKGVRS